MPYKTKEELLKLGEIDPELAELLKTLDLPPVDYNDLPGFKKEAEKRAADVRAMLGDAPPGVKVSEVSYTTTDGTTLSARLHQPVNPPSSGSPLVVLYYGGGFCVGSPDGEEQTARNLVLAFGAVCLTPVYRLAPEFKFPHAVKDGWDALKFAAANAASFGADPSKGFVIGGTSAGGNITAVLAHIARDEGLSPPLTGQYLAIPAVCSHKEMPEKYKDRHLSYEQNQNAPVLPQALIDTFIRGYSPDTKDYVWFNCMLHPKGHASLPPAYFQIAGMDALRDEALIYESILREDYNIRTKVDMYPGMPHGHWIYFPMLKQSNKFREEQVDGFGWLLGKTPEKSGTDTDAKPGLG